MVVVVDDVEDEVDARDFRLAPMLAMGGALVDIDEAMLSGGGIVFLLLGKGLCCC